jgi:hypothetical protein
MICKNCGKEIPDTALFCGYCGAKQVKIKEDTAAVSPEDEKPVSREEEAVEGSVQPSESREAEKPSEDVKTDEEPSETVIEAETKETEQPAQEKKGSSIGQKFRSSQAGKKVLGEDGKFTREDFDRISGSAANKIKATARKVNWQEFHTFLEILKDPFSDHELAKVPTITALAVMLILNWPIFGSFASGLVVLALVCAGSLVIQYAGRGEEPFSFSKAVSEAVQTAFIPFLAMFAAALFGGFGLRYNSLTRMHSEFILILIMTVFALVMLTIGLIRSGRKINAWKGALIITVTYALIAYYLYSQMISSLFAMM